MTWKRWTFLAISVVFIGATTHFARFDVYAARLDVERFTYQATPASAPAAVGFGELIYLSHPEDIVEAIHYAEQVPSYGNEALARAYGGHRAVPENVARVATADLLHQWYADWVRKGRQQDLLVFVRDRYAPLLAENDPDHLNQAWLPNVTRYLRAHYQYLPSASAEASAFTSACAVR
ncbi:MAG TPA: hypothetical protein VJT33_01790 [bacterium]|nr:hypothetical protein [bacterium]